MSLEGLIDGMKMNPIDSETGVERTEEITEIVGMILEMTGEVLQLEIGTIEGIILIITGETLTTIDHEKMNFDPVTMSEEQATIEEIIEGSI